MMRSKKAVTDIILAIGILVAILMVFLIGLRVFSLVVKETPEFLSKEMAFTANTVLAAPENVEIQNTLPQARNEGFLKSISKSWAAFIDPKKSKACAAQLTEDDITNFLSVVGLSVGIIPTGSISYSGDEATIAGYSKKFKCSSFTEDKFSDEGDAAGFPVSSLTVKTYNATTNKTKIEVTNG
jgi:hypothetical protein